MPVRLPARVKLLPHPAAAPGAATCVEAQIGPDASGNLHLHYRLEHDGGLRVPTIRTPGLAGELWRHTCCEAFIAVVGEAAYREFNFSPSGQWAVYDFIRYRERARQVPPEIPPDIDVRATAGLLRVDVLLPAALLPAAPPGCPWLLGLSAVTEDAGCLRYWALRHPAAQADFHDRRGFALTLSPLSRSPRPGCP